MLLFATLAAAQVPTYQATVLADYPIAYWVFSLMSNGGRYS
jgi:hypothetical protein